ncbi:hypothetical protein CLHOM_06110 [Clostridium homopropionicum DSM 5847]|uniref:Uncharacterized protein n=1 Tax=Clostridium homopropionicum DSM 5847 TaxID=1121318 RepID=A0A0L6ZDY6_9CLOT|nr:hypothetical protein [Clostridium homopropionicum]KOA21023.1 hypothetical protein CLHOM_06110 [Clostridium homopropionicum DSM 5847]SFF99213.1 hypothetical protein SAMN04488501_104109 [Clostridium homopropionicum]
MNHTLYGKKLLVNMFSKYTNNDDITLILRIPQDINFENNIKLIEKLITGINDSPDILILNDILDDNRRE